MTTDCPYFTGGMRCDGELVCDDTVTTHMGITTGVNSNLVKESFHCETCGRKFERTYQWELIEEKK
ncbi:hypothetical protein LCGC14_2476630 [marine sediment metagenome]|uniref:C2H2-type domain-containing protein n=1 Tax=marine sediment metagenome TaxID=412755 RepID=A0A0F9E2M7_9ZZZZ